MEPKEEKPQTKPIFATNSRTIPYPLDRKPTTHLGVNALLLELNKARSEVTLWSENPPTDEQAKSEQWERLNKLQQASRNIEEFIPEFRVEFSTDINSYVLVPARSLRYWVDTYQPHEGDFYTKQVTATLYDIYRYEEAGEWQYMTTRPEEEVASFLQNTFEMGTSRNKQKKYYRPSGEEK